MGVSRLYAAGWNRVIPVFASRDMESAVLSASWRKVTGSSTESVWQYRHCSSYHFPISSPMRIPKLLCLGLLPVVMSLLLPRVLRSLGSLRLLHQLPQHTAAMATTTAAHSGQVEPFRLDSLTSTNIEQRYRPYKVASTADDWVSQLDLTPARTPSFTLPSTAPNVQQGQAAISSVAQPHILVLYGSLRAASKSRLCAYEFARILDRYGADVRVFDPVGLPLKDDSTETHPKVQELRQLSDWSTAQVWVTPEQHGTITGIMKNQIDQIPLSLGSVRPTQGRVLAVAQVNGGSQSFNAVNTLRPLGRWMRMFTIPNQSSIPKAWQEFVPADEPHGRLRPSDFRQRVVDVAEELYKFAVLVQPHSTYLVDRFSEREEKGAVGRLRSQAEKESQKERDKLLAQQAHGAHTDNAAQQSQQ